MNEHGATQINFPFIHLRAYSLDELNAFEEQILYARGTDRRLSEELRAPSNAWSRWAKQRNDELIPLSYFARHRSLSGRTSFVLTGPGDPVDIRLTDTEGHETNLQLTVADPSWPGTRNPGYDRRLALERLNQRGGGNGIGPFRRNSGEIVGHERMISTADLELALVEGLVKALTNKIRQVGTGCDLVVFARTYSELTSSAKFRSLVETIPNNRVPNSFDHVYVIDGPDGFFVEVKSGTLGTVGS